MFLGLRSVLCVPLQHKGSVLGVVYVDNRVQSGIFSPADLDLLTAIAASAAAAIENARLYQIAVDRGRIEQELRMARQVQVSLLPETAPQVAGWDFAAAWQPARQVAGDFYDFIWTDSGELGVVIADVADKGMPAALFMALSRSTLRACLVPAASPEEGMQNANRLISGDSAHGMFVTVFYAQFDIQTGQVRYVNAGHNPPFLYNRGKNRWTRLTRTAIAAGVLAGQPVKQAETRLEPGDFLFLYTDGVTEAMNADGQEYGEQRLLGVLQAHREDSPAALAEVVQGEVTRFTGAIAPFDDITLLIVKRLA
jgi:sigma-B regulation protein RsbU (phosphoserine phosphatase)